MKLPGLEEKVLTNSDGEGQTFVRNRSGRIVIHSGDGDHSTGSLWDCYESFYATNGSFFACVFNQAP